MEKPMYPSKVIRITQKHGVGTHKNNYAVDEAGIDGGISNLIAPFTGVVKKIYTSDANEVWLESSNKVEYADGTIDYMTIMLAHDNDVSNLWVGKVIKQGEVFYQEGTKGQATGNHVHFECAKGKFTGTGWYNDGVAWAINNGKRADQCLWIDDTYTIKDTKGYTFKKVVTHFGTPVARNEKVDQVKIKDGMTTVRARKAPNGAILGYMNIGLYNILERKTEGDYEWIKVQNDLWFANSKDWCEVLPKKEEPKPVVDEDKVEIEKLNKQIATKDATIKSLEEQNKAKDETIKILQEKIENQPKEVFTCTRTDNYQIKLYDGEKLYIREQ